jgi:nitrite reductase (NO-forming)
MIAHHWLTIDRKAFVWTVLLTVFVLWTGGCQTQPPAPGKEQSLDTAVNTGLLTYTLTTAHDNGKMVYKGLGGSIDGLINPDLLVTIGEPVRIVVVNGDGMPHDLAILELNVQTALAAGKEDRVEVVFTAGESGTYAYYCTVTGHRQAGMEGWLIVSEP